MKLREIINAEEKEFSRFRIDRLQKDRLYFIRVYDKKDFTKLVGEILGGEFREIGGEFKEYYTVIDVSIHPDYQGRGYSKFLYKNALELAKKNGLTGLMVGLGLLNEIKSMETYKNFERHERMFENQFNQKTIILTEWAPEKKEENENNKENNK